MAIGWSAPGCVPWFPYRWETDKVLPLEEDIHVVREHERYYEQVFSVVPVTTCDSFMTVEAARQELRVFQGVADSKDIKLSRLLSSPVAGSDAYGRDRLYDGNLDEGE